MESTYTESTISKLEDKEETIKFDESELEEQLHRGRDKREDYHFILVILQPVDIKFFQYVNQLILVQYYLLFSELFLIILILKNHQPSDDNDDKVNKADAAAKTKFSNYSFNSDDIGDIVENSRLI